MPGDRIPTFEEITRITFYDRTDPALVGRPYFMGKDEKGNAVYFMGMWNQRQPLSSTLNKILQSAGIAKERYLLQDSFPVLNFSTKVGGAISKRFSITGLGRRLSVWGIQRKYPEFVALVATVKKRLE